MPISPKLTTSANIAGVSPSQGVFKLSRSSRASIYSTVPFSLLFPLVIFGKLKMGNQIFPTILHDNNIKDVLQGISIPKRKFGGKKGKV
ncbi:hypothetical protein AAHA92_12683 [Salvia divinorum]|uniref:Ribosomal protein S19 n=1 Tax=Salvia divinorum TaxID=28513 RepID=A0ABD1HL13_SALDI